jgi:predicted amidohydrolase YtcJ
MRMILSGLAAALLTPLVPMTARAAETADAVFWGGPIYTAVEARPKVEAVAVIKGRIAYAGDREGAQSLVGPKTQVVDLKGAAMFPGFTDSHAHLRGIGERELRLNLEGSKSAAEAMNRLKSHLAKSPGTGTVIGGGWIETGWPEGRFLNRQDLDTVAPDRPVLLVRADGHALVANSAALKAAGVGPQTLAPDGGQILKDAQGQPTGMLVDNAMALVSGLRTAPSEADKLAAYRAAFTVETRYGWTGVHNMSVDWADVALLEDLARKGEAPLRVYNAVAGPQSAQLLKDGPRSAADGRIVTRTIKLFADGALGSRGAALFAPYSDAPETSGALVTTPEVMKPIMVEALKSGIQIVTHAIGDRGNAVTLDLYRDAFAEVPPEGRKTNDLRWRVEHAQVIRPADLQRFPQTKVIASMQPSHAIGDLHFAPARLGPDRLEGAYAWRSLLDKGAVVVGGSDAPVERGDPLIEFYAAVARKDLAGASGPDWRPQEALDRAEALKLFTSASAYARFAEDDLGRIEPGKRADLSAFSVDLMTAPEAAIPKGHAVLTVIDGKVVFDGR